MRFSIDVREHHADTQVWVIDEDPGYDAKLLVHGGDFGSTATKLKYAQALTTLLNANADKIPCCPRN